MLHRAAALLLLALLTLPLAPAAADGQTAHRLAIHVDENDVDKMNLALNNATNLIDFYAARNEPVTVEIVAYGPGLHMLRADSSPVKERLAGFMKKMPDVTFAACGNTRAGMQKKEGKAIELLPNVTVVEAGVVRLLELQEQGYAYLKP